jgi:hypothetical protein
MKKNQKRFAMLLLGVTVALAVLGAVRGQFFSTPDEATATALAKQASGPISVKSDHDRSGSH